MRRGACTLPMPAASTTHLELVIGIVLFWLALGAVALLRPFRSAAARRLLYASGAIGGVALAGIALPDAIVPLRKKMDVARSLLERSRGEVALAVRMDEHARAIRRATRAKGGRKRA